MSCSGHELTAVMSSSVRRFRARSFLPLTFNFIHTPAHTLLGLVACEPIPLSLSDAVFLLINITEMVDSKILVHL